MPKKKQALKKHLCFVTKKVKKFFKGMILCCVSPKTSEDELLPPVSLVTRATQTECLSVVHRLSHEGEAMTHRSSEHSSLRDKPSSPTLGSSETSALCLQDYADAFAGPMSKRSKIQRCMSLPLILTSSRPDSKIRRAKSLQRVSNINTLKTPADLSSDSSSSHQVQLYSLSDPKANNSNTLKTLTRGSKKVKARRSRSTQLSLDNVEAAYLNNGIVGFINLGNSCYMNSIMQCLSHSLEMTDIFLSCDRKTMRARGSICTEYQKAMQNVWLKHSKCKVIATPLQSIFGQKHVNFQSVTLLDLKKAIGKECAQFSTFEQNDAQEFLRHMIGGLHGEMKHIDTAIPETFSVTGLDLSDREKGKVKWESYQSFDGSPIANIFMGQFKSSLKCTICKNTSPTFEPFWDMGLPIDIPREGEKYVDLHRCLSLFAENEIMDGDNEPFCQKCCKNQPSIKTMTVSRFPPVLTLYMKRFSYSGKLVTPVRIPVSIDLTTYSSPETVEDFGGAKICYELYGIVNHYGTLYSGHYTADVKHFTSQQWFNYNDHRIRRRPQFRKAVSITSAEAYILFYRRNINFTETCVSNGGEQPSKSSDESSASLNNCKASNEQNIAMVYVAGIILLRVAVTLVLNNLNILMNYALNILESEGEGVDCE